MNSESFGKGLIHFTIHNIKWVVGVYFSIQLFSFLVAYPLAGIIDAMGMSTWLTPQLNSKDKLEAMFGSPSLCLAAVALYPSVIRGLLSPLNNSIVAALFWICTALSFNQTLLIASLVFSLLALMPVILQRLSKWVPNSLLRFYGNETTGLGAFKYSELLDSPLENR